MQKFINIPGVSIKILDIFKLPEDEKPEIKRKREYQETQQLNAIKLLYNSIYSAPNVAAWHDEKPNKETKKGLVYILTKSIRKGVNIQLSVFLKDITGTRVNRKILFLSIILQLLYAHNKMHTSTL